MVSVIACVAMTVLLYGLFTREWMDVLSPPIMPPSQQRRSGNIGNNRENLIGGTVALISVLWPPDTLSCPLKSVRQQQTILCFNTDHTNCSNASH